MNVRTPPLSADGSDCSTSAGLRGRLRPVDADRFLTSDRYDRAHHEHRQSQPHRADHRRSRLHRLASLRAAPRRKAGRSSSSTTCRPARRRTSRTCASTAAFHLVVDSVLKSSVVNELVHRSDVVFHLAAAVGVRLIVEEPVHTLVTNIQGTEDVLDHCHRFGKRVLVASTSEVYGDRREPEALDEESKRMYGPTTARRWAYAESKALDEFLALAYHQERGLDCVIVRLFNTVGPRQSGQYGMVIPRFVSGRARRRHARDPRRRHADALLLPRAGHDPRALRALMDADTAGEIFNVGSTERVSIGELARARDRAHRTRAPRSSTSRTTRSTARGSRTCSTASRRSRR